MQKVHYSLKLYFLRHQPELLDWGDTDPLTASDSERSGEDKGGYHLTRMWFKKKNKCKSKNMITPKKHSFIYIGHLNLTCDLRVEGIFTAIAKK